MNRNETQALLESIGNGLKFGFAIVKYFDNTNYYSPENPNKIKSQGELFTYGIAEIVGWRQAGEEICLRMGASGWGFRGYAYVPKNSPLIVKLYSVQMLGTQEINTEQE